MVTGDYLPRAALGLLSPASGVMTGAPALWEDPLPPPSFLAQRKVQLCALFYFYLPWGSESTQGAASSQGMTMKHKLFIICHMQGHRLGGVFLAF